MLQENPKELFGKPNISNHHVVHFKYIVIFLVSYTSIKEKIKV